MRNIYWICLCIVWLSACNAAGSTTVTPSSPTPALPPASSPTSPSTREATEPILPSPTSETTLLPTPSPAPTLTEWEIIQQQVAKLRDLLDRDSDGYASLTAALEQEAPDSQWCAGLRTAIGDFNYVGDNESAQALERLRESQGCP